MRPAPTIAGRSLLDANLRGKGFLPCLTHSAALRAAPLQMVDRLDEGLIPPSVGGSTYSLLHDLVARIFRTHVEGKLKAEIIQDPARFVGAFLEK